MQEQKMKWIKSTEKLPDNDGWYHVVVKDYPNEIRDTYFKKGTFGIDCNKIPFFKEYIDLESSVLWWMPFPDPPKDKHD